MYTGTYERVISLPLDIQMAINRFLNIVTILVQRELILAFKSRQDGLGELRHLSRSGYRPEDSGNNARVIAKIGCIRSCSQGVSWGMPYLIHRLLLRRRTHTLTASHSPWVCQTAESPALLAHDMRLAANMAWRSNEFRFAKTRNGQRRQAFRTPKVA